MLQGCVNDAEDWATQLDKRSFQVRTLLDENATGDGIRDAIRERLDAARPGDLVVITFSGFGTWVPDRIDTEPHRRQQALCPYDVFSAGPLLDDELLLLLTTRREDVRVVLVSDSCHSGALCRYATAHGFESRRSRFLPPEIFLPEEQLSIAGRIPPVYRDRPRDAALLMTGCRYGEFAFDATFDGRANGAFTYVAIAALQMVPDTATYLDWMTRIGQILPSQDHPQTPGIHGFPDRMHYPVLS